MHEQFENLKIPAYFTRILLQNNNFVLYNCIIMSYYSSYAFGIPDWDAHEILPNIYLGSAAAAQEVKELQNRNITHIISINHSPSYLPFYPEKFEYLVVIAEDDLYQELLSVVSDCFAFIDECLKEDGKVLIHCTAGVSRSATIVAAHVMREYECSADVAVTMLQGRRPYVQPNLGFSAQLRIFHDSGRDLTQLLKQEALVKKLKEYHRKPTASRYWKGNKYSTQLIQFMKQIPDYLENMILFYSVLPSSLPNIGTKSK